MNQQALDFTAAREAGRAAAEACMTKAIDTAGFDADGSAKFIVGHLRRFGPTSGEDLVDAAMEHGYRGHDARCFGGVFKTLLRKGEILLLRSDLPRRRGHGTSGGRLCGVPA